MFSKHVSELNYLDIYDLVNVQKEREGYHLDYKGEIGSPDKSKKELSKDISSFGNTDGGYLIIGVDKEYKIVGIEPTILTKPIDEWLNQVLSSNIDPPVFYNISNPIQIPESDKVLMVIHVPESSKKPHMVSETHQYFIRINDSSKPTTHNQVREMFDFSRRRTEEYRDFLIKRNLYDEDNPEFGQTRLTKKLYSDIPEKLNLKKPLVIFSLIPKYPNEERIKIPYRQFQDWLEQNSGGYEPKPQMKLFNSRTNFDLILDGVIFNGIETRTPMSYFLIMNNGYIEVGFSQYITGIYNNDGHHLPCLNWTQVIGYELLLLGFSRRFYEYINYNDQVEIQISFVNVLNFKLLGWKFHSDTRFKTDPTVNVHHNNFKINTSFNPRTSTDEEIIQIGKENSLKLGRGFGLDHDSCFDDHGRIDIDTLSNL